MIGNKNYKLIQKNYPHADLANCFYHKKCINNLNDSSVDDTGPALPLPRSLSLWQSIAFKNFCTNIIEDLIIKKGEIISLSQLVIILIDYLETGSNAMDVSPDPIDEANIDIISSGTAPQPLSGCSMQHNNTIQHQTSLRSGRLLQQSDTTNAIRIRPYDLKCRLQAKYFGDQTLIFLSSSNPNESEVVAHYKSTSLIDCYKKKYGAITMAK